MNTKRSVAGLVVGFSCASIGGCAILLGLSSSLTAAVIAQHLGATDPITEGWVKVDESGGGHTFAPVFNDLGTTNAWKIDTSHAAGDGNYQFSPNSTQVEDALSNGWSLRASVRVIDVEAGLPHNELFFATGTTAYGLGFGMAVNGDPVIRLDPVGPTPGYSIPVTGGAGAYHLYELRDTDSSGSVDLLIDGEIVLTDVPRGEWNANPALIFFGDLLGEMSDANFNYALVVLESFGPPNADFDWDGDVDGDDFLRWQVGFGAGVNSGGTKMDGDYDNDGDVDGDDFLGWQSEFGSGGSAAAVAVPEPSSVVLLLAVLACSASWARRAEKISCVWCSACRHDVGANNLT